MHRFRFFSLLLTSTWLQVSGIGHTLPTFADTHGDRFSTSDSEDISYPTVPNIADYPTFYTNLYVQSFRGIPGVPWTGLGYTYDWGNPVTEVGPSEFIMAPNTAYHIHQVQPTFTYCSVEDQV